MASADMPERVDDAFVGKNAVGGRKLMAQLSMNVAHGCPLRFVGGKFLRRNGRLL